MPLILGTNSIKDTAYSVDNSCRFNDDDGAYMHKTPSSSGSQRTFTFSTWWKQGDLASSSVIFASGEADGDPNFAIYYNSSQQLNVMYYEGSTLLQLITNAQYRDPSAWYHICVAIDTTQGTNTNRAKIYINGSQVTSLATSTYCNQNVDISINTNSYRMSIGTGVDDGDDADGYMAETVFIDGTAYAASDFGEFDEDTPTVFKPKDVSELTFGTNGFYLDFEDSANLGNDKNGGTDLTEVNLAATDQSTDTCTNNFATMNPLATGSNITLSEGNLVTLGNTSSDSGLATMTIPFAFSGKWYWEVKMTDAKSDYPYMGIFDDWESVSDADLNGAGGAALAMDAYIRGGNTTLVKTGTNLTITAPADNDIIMFAIDRDNNKFYIGNNGTWYNSGDPTTGATGTGSLFNLTANTITMFGIHEYNGSDSSVNFGNPAYANSSSVADANGYGAFEYAVPSGYYALCTKNLAEFGG